MGGDEATLRAVTLDGWAEFVVDRCRGAVQRPVILVGHSRGGIVISRAAELAPESIDTLVYVCAVMLPDGMSRVEFRDHCAPNPAFDAITLPVYGGAGTVIDTRGAAAVFCQLAPAAAVARVLPRLVAEPSAPRATHMRITPARFGRIPRHYIECTEDRAIYIESQRLMQRLVPGASVTTLPSDHSPYLCCVDRLCSALLQLT